MIKNVIFDFGQVLAHFDPEYMTSVYIKDKEDAELVKNVVFDRLYWDKLDKGTISDDEVVALSLSRLPRRLHKVAEKVYRNWMYNIPEVDGMREIIEHIKQTYGVRLYLLSNISEGFAEHKDEFPILKYMEGLVFSATCGFVKPDMEIFDYILTRYGLSAEETVFVDDNMQNVESAQDMGIRSFLFQKNPQELRAWLDKIIGENK